MHRLAAALIALDRAAEAASGQNRLISSAWQVTASRKSHGVVGKPAVTTSNAELARLSLLTPQTMSVIVGNLERTGLISRRSHEQHGRVLVIEITESGLQLLARCKLAAQQAETAVRRWLAEVARNFDDTRPDNNALPDAPR
jgi:DNA-binding MarR family transcriptional regulator